MAASARMGPQVYTLGQNYLQYLNNMQWDVLVAHLLDKKYYYSAVVVS